VQKKRHRTPDEKQWEKDRGQQEVSPSRMQDHIEQPVADNVITEKRQPCAPK
jgi:hypothetical protein